ncbi:hypothetical protein FACS189476_10330 [Spirochaetia bacterium]|nr:hypothetical protein FACS189476_10330 [Spirochaetia bacterium]
MKSSKIFLGMLVLVLAFGFVLTGCEQPDTSNWYDDLYSNVGPDLLKDKVLFQGWNWSEDKALTEAEAQSQEAARYTFKDGTYVKAEYEFAPGATTRSWVNTESGKYNYNIAQEQVQFRQLRTQAEDWTSADRVFQKTFYLAALVTAGVDVTEANKWFDATPGKDSDGLIDPKDTVQYKSIKYFKDNPTKYLAFYNATENFGNPAISEADFLKDTGYTKLEDYLKDTYRDLPQLQYSGIIIRNHVAVALGW